VAFVDSTGVTWQYVSKDGGRTWRYNPAGRRVLANDEQTAHTRASTGRVELSGQPNPRRGADMAGSVYRVTEVIGVSDQSWEEAARNAVETAARTVRDLRIAEVIRQDLTIENGGVTSYRVRLGISFKYDSGD
jgi:flavin-binding protein dodecin